VDLRTITSIISILARAGSAVRTAARRRSLSDADAECVVRFARRLEERRVFTATMNSEVIECCMGSISSAADFAEEALSAVDDARARAVIGAIRDHLRDFRDRHYGARTPDRWNRRHEPWWDAGDGDVMTFFTDLGGLRENVRSLLALLADIEPRIRPNTLIDGAALPP